MHLRAIPFLGLARSWRLRWLTPRKCPRGALTRPVTYVRDGDTIVVGSMPIRLNGLAAPEGDEPGGAAATQTMLELVQGRTLRCELDGERTHDRCVGVCYLDGAAISEVMIDRGAARDCPRFSQGRYAKVKTLRGDDYRPAQMATIGDPILTEAYDRMRLRAGQSAASRPCRPCIGPPVGRLS